MGDQQQIAFVTHSRDDLIGMSKLIGENIKCEELQSPSAPFIVSVHGTYGTGKSLIAEEIAKVFIDTQSLLFDSEGHTCFSPRTNKSFQVQFRDIACGFSSHGQIHKQIGHIEKALERQINPGIIFIHNAPFAVKKLADLDIYIGAAAQYPKPHEAMPHIPNKFGCFPVGEGQIAQHGLLHDFRKAMQTKDPDWVRFVKCELRNPDRFNPDFIEKIDMLNEVEFQRQIKARPIENMGVLF